MKKRGILSALILAAIVWTSLVVPAAHAAPGDVFNQGTIIMRITVNQLFRLDLGTFRGGVGGSSFDFVPLSNNTIQFPTTDPGQFVGGLPSVEARVNAGDAGVQSGLIMKVGTNNGQPWRLQVNVNQPLTRDGGGDTIPNNNFIYWTWVVDGEATPSGLVQLPLQNPDGSRFNTVSTTAFTIYNSVSSSATNLPGNETLDPDTRVHMQFGIQVPAVRPGVYRSNVIITLTE